MGICELVSDCRLAPKVPAIAALEQMALVGIRLLLLQAGCSVTFVLSLVGRPLHTWLECSGRARLDFPVAAVAAAAVVGVVVVAAAAVAVVVGAALLVVAVVELGSVLLLVQ